MERGGLLVCSCLSVCSRAAGVGRGQSDLLGSPRETYPEGLDLVTVTRRGCAFPKTTQPGLAPAGPVLTALSFPICPQALKKDDGVPWTGMLAIVHSYVTHKTGEASLRAGRGSPPPQPTLHCPTQASGITWDLWELDRCSHFQARALRSPRAPAGREFPEPLAAAGLRPGLGVESRTPSTAGLRPDLGA